VATGTGTVDTEHGTLPLPAPAVLELLTGAPMRYLPIDVELITPTGAAILAEICEFEAPPPMVISSTGYGAGTRDLPELPNVVRVTLGAEIGRATPGDQLNRAIVIEATIDDMNPEILAYAMERLLGAGALDVWMTPAIGKKGRQATVLSVVSAGSLADDLREIILTETSTLGVRSYAVDRVMLERKIVEVEVLGHRVGVKVGIRKGAPVNVAPEYADCADVAMKTEEPLKLVYQLAMEAYAALNQG
ncbi:MAG TPA: LarC family nickel insertion protein, partial [Actinomycetota bacterium]|nr:LarC family nickel insertion protein [Actinomycetota bacterium]